jgi:hypothetical protein
MPKLVTVKRQGTDLEKAQEYVKTHMLFPSSVLGLICVVSSAATLVYQFVTGSYEAIALAETTGLLAAGMVLGWGQTRYHQYLLREFPWYFASKMRTFERKGPVKSRKDVLVLDHRGRAVAPLAYTVGAGALVALSLWSYMAGHVANVAAFLMPWAGFFWARLFFWRKVLGQGKS